MTPISFALEILLDCETIEEAHKKCRKFIKLYETTEITISKRINTPVQNPGAMWGQAPSTQRLLEAQNTVPLNSKLPLTPQLPPGSTINNGDGTMGKKKW